MLRCHFPRNMPSFQRNNHQGYPFWAHFFQKPFLIISHLCVSAIEPQSGEYEAGPDAFRITNKLFSQTEYEQVDFTETAS